MTRLLLAALAVLILTCLPAPAHDPTHQGIHDDWFRSLRNKQGGSCCDGSDAVRLEDPEWRQTPATPEEPEGGYEVNLGDGWQKVKPDNLVHGTNRVGYAIVWPMHINGKLVPRCFMPGSGA